MPGIRIATIDICVQTHNTHLKCSMWLQFVQHRLQNIYFFRFVSTISMLMWRTAWKSNHLIELLLYRRGDIWLWIVFTFCMCGFSCAMNKYLNFPENVFIYSGSRNFRIGKNEISFTVFFFFFFSLRRRFVRNLTFSERNVPKHILTK